MLVGMGRLFAAYLAQVLAMCVAVALLTMTFGAWKFEQFASGFIVLLVFSLMVIPLRVMIPFLLIWVVIHAFRYRGRWPLLVLGGLCGLFVFMTLPNAEDGIWTFRWRDFGSMKPSDWQAAGGLIVSGCFGGWVAGCVGKRPWVRGFGWHTSPL
ncbi:hypothetical protein [Afipia sp. GAS231]|uniref:hypothetical protein n=1 Tax=Afipia sp. GAS231 TaxID=1882747 RepID=UPI000B8934BF|nr:hypothetical protein [Afipia sp. GAS231]